MQFSLLLIIWILMHDILFLGIILLPHINFYEEWIVYAEPNVNRSSKCRANFQLVNCDLEDIHTKKKKKKKSAVDSQTRAVCTSKM